MSSTWLPIRYRDFYDIPRAVVVEWRGDTFLLDCLFDQDSSEYEPTYSVYRLPRELEARLEGASWTDLGHRGTLLTQIKTSEVIFDPSKRKAIDESVMLGLGLS